MFAFDFETSGHNFENGSNIKFNSVQAKQVVNACKAFDVVWQNSLLRKIHNVGIQGKLWLCLSNL